jgi:hypothetical protein
MVTKMGDNGAARLVNARQRRNHQQGEREEHREHDPRDEWNTTTHPT